MEKFKLDRYDFYAIALLALIGAAQGLVLHSSAAKNRSEIDTILDRIETLEHAAQMEVECGSD